MKYFVLTFQGQDGNQAISPKFFRCLIFEVRYEPFKIKKGTHGSENGGIAQLGEHLLCKQGVIGSIPIISTKGRKDTDHTSLKHGLIAQQVRASA